LSTYIENVQEGYENSEDIFKKKNIFAGDTTPTSRDIPDIYISESAEYIF
jgi:hypothetical protein